MLWRLLESVSHTILVIKHGEKRELAQQLQNEEWLEWINSQYIETPISY